MKAESLACVVTTIQPPTPSMGKWTAALDGDAALFVVGDRRGPAAFDLPGAEFFSLARQLSRPWRLSQSLPTGHYARKNLGYLEAIAWGAGCIYETDDDNAPNDRWRPRTRRTSARIVDRPGWCNVYRLFTDQPVWPRGFPLEKIARGDCPAAESLPSLEADAPIQQGLADASPDVDAIWRLVQDRHVAFDANPSVLLRPGVWCPFNSQTTWWRPAAYRLMYLPSYCSIRMTDIWRSFVAQRCLWELDLGVVFHAAEVVQQRNAHDLLRDFQDEIPGYLGNQRLIESLERTPLRPGQGNVGDNLVRCYETLVDGGFVDRRELPLVRAWLSDLGAAVCGEFVAMLEAA